MNFYEFDLLIQEGKFWNATKGAAAGAAIAGGALIGLHGSNPQINPPAPTTLPAKISMSPKQDVDFIANYIAKNEGKRNKMYDDGIGNKTIGIGHLIRQSDDSLFSSIGTNLQNVLRGQPITGEQIQLLFKHDLQIHMNRLQQRVKNIDNLPTYLQAALVDATFRGDLGPKTVNLINNNMWEAAAEEYLNHKQYTNRNALGIPGIGVRMEKNRDMMLRYAKEPIG